MLLVTAPMFWPAATDPSSLMLGFIGRSSSSTVDVLKYHSSAMISPSAQQSWALLELDGVTPVVFESRMGARHLLGGHRFLQFPWLVVPSYPTCSYLVDTVVLSFLSSDIPLCFAVLCCNFLLHFVAEYLTLKYCPIFYCAMLFCSALYCSLLAVQNGITSPCVVILSCAVLHYTVLLLYSAVLYCSLIFSIILSCTIL